MDRRFAAKLVRLSILAVFVAGITPTLPASAVVPASPSLTINFRGEPEASTAFFEMKAGGTRTFELHIRNDGDTPDRFSLDIALDQVIFPAFCCGGSPLSWARFDIAVYKADGTNVSQKIEAGTFSTKELALGQAQHLTLVVHLASDALARRKTWNITAAPLSDPSSSDTVQLAIKRRL